MINQSEEKRILREYFGSDDRWVIRYGLARSGRHDLLSAMEEMEKRGLITYSMHYDGYKIMPMGIKLRNSRD